MGGYLADTEEIYPSIYIQTTEDNTQMLPKREGGQVCGMGWVNLGNPLLPISMNQLDRRRESTNPKHYPEADRANAFKKMSIYTIKDFLLYSNNRTLHLSRIMGIDSQMSILKLVKDGENYLFNSEQKVDIFKNGTMNAWEETEQSEAIEMLIKFCWLMKMII